VLAWANRQPSATSALVEEKLCLGCTFSKHSRIHFVQIAPRLRSLCLHHEIITCFRQISHAPHEFMTKENRSVVCQQSSS
jgi:hypothetical protein